MINAWPIFIVLFVAACFLILLLWRRVRHASDAPLGTGADPRPNTRVVAEGEATAVTSGELAEEQRHDPRSTDQTVGELEAAAEAASDQTLVDEVTEGPSAEEACPSAETGTDAATGPETAFRPPACAPKGTSYGEAIPATNSPPEEQVARNRQQPTASNSDNVTPVEEARQRPPPTTDPSTLVSEDKPPTDGVLEDQTPSRQATSRSEPQNEKDPRRYGGLTRKPPRPRTTRRQKRRVEGIDNVERKRSRPIEVRLRFDRGGSCIVSLIASRWEGAPEGASVTSASGALDLRAMQDDWYEDVMPQDIGQILRAGTTWREEEGVARWSLSGRGLYVLGQRSDLSGWVSQPCLKLGQQHVVLCTEQLRSEAERLLREAGVAHLTALDPAFGGPPGWVVIRDVVPVHPLPPPGQADALNALRPLPDLEISLEGGVRLEYAAWLDGYAPLVRVYGDPVDMPEVRIDDHTAYRADDGAYRAPGWDTTGTHTVWCAGTSKSYSIVPFEASWELWDAYAFASAPGSDRHLAICGPMVRDNLASDDHWTSTIQVPETNTMILGASPGQLAVATRASPVPGLPCIVSPSFQPVWALPPDPLHSSKRRTRILFLGGRDQEVPAFAQHPPARPHTGTDTWVKLILNASRKGLAFEPDTGPIRALWRSYSRAARRIWRSRR